MREQVTQLTIPSQTHTKERECPKTVLLYLATTPGSLVMMMSMLQRALQILKVIMFQNILTYQTIQH